MPAVTGADYFAAWMPDFRVLRQGAAEARCSLENPLPRRSSGPGIPEKDRDRVFDMFYRANAGDEQRAGTGLGLAISKGIVEAHGGRIRVCPPKGGGTGTCIEIKLPIGPTLMVEATAGRSTVEAE